MEQLGSNTDDMERLEAHQTLYKGQSNVLLIARDLGIGLEEIKQSFREYVAANPLEGDEWNTDVEPSWPWR